MTSNPDFRDIQLWIFDMDDTLYPEYEFVYGGYRAASRKTEEDYGVAIESALLRRFAAGERGDIFTRVLQDNGIAADESYVQLLVRAYREHSPELTPFPDVVPFLDRLRDQSLKLAVLTDGLEAVQRRKWNALGLAEYFDLAVFTDSLRGKDSWKPSPDGFMLALNGLSVEPGKAVYVGDNPLKDFVAPRALGMKSIRIVRPEAQHRKLAAIDPSYEADVCITSLSSL